MNNNKLHLKCIIGAILISSAFCLYSEPEKNSIQSNELESKTNSESDNNQNELMIKKFFDTIILKRDLKMAASFYCTQREFIVSKKKQDGPEDVIKKNYIHDGGMFLDDCSKIMDILPKQNLDSIRVREIKKLTDDSISNLKEGVVYKCTFSYGNGTGRFDIVFPSIINTGGGAKFATRFWEPFRLVL